MNNQFEQTWEKIKTDRDELKLQMHLAHLELKDEWENSLEPKWHDAQHKIKNIVDGSKENVHEISLSLSVIAEELNTAYDRIRARLEH